MKLSNVMALIKINLLYSDTKQRANKNKKGQAKEFKKKPNNARRLFLTYLFTGILYIALFSINILLTPIEQYPAFFSQSIATFCLMLLFMTLVNTYNIFFEARDLQALRPLPFRDSEVFLAKTVTVFLSGSFTIFPLITLCLGLAVKYYGFNLSLLLGLLLAIIAAASIFFIAYGICLILLTLMTKLPLYERYNKVISSALTVVSVLTLIGSILILQKNQIESPDVTTLQFNAFSAPFAVVHSFITGQFNAQTIVSYIVIALVIVGILYSIERYVIPNFYYDNQKAITTNSTKKRQITKDYSLTQHFLRLNLKAIEHTSVITNSIVMAALTPYFFFMGLLFSPAEFEFNSGYVAIISTIAILIASLNQSSSSLPGIMISLDRENFHYIRALPFSMRHYLTVKFLFAVVISNILPFILLTAFMLFFKLTWPLILLAYFSWGVFSIWMAMFYYKRDYRLLIVDWSNIMDLYMRGNLNQIVATILLIGSLFVIGFTIFGLAWMMMHLPLIVTYAIAGGINAFISLGCIYYYFAKFRPFLKNFD